MSNTLSEIRKEMGSALSAEELEVVCDRHRDIVKKLATDPKLNSDVMRIVSFKADRLTELENEECND